jgi:hypothetical protein
VLLSWEGKKSTALYEQKLRQSTGSRQSSAEILWLNRTVNGFAPVDKFKT